MCFGFVDWEKHFLDARLGVTHGSVVFNHFDLQGVQFTIDCLGYPAKFAGLLMTS
jgi:hypothetical protein